MIYKLSRRLHPSSVNHGANHKEDGPETCRAGNHYTCRGDPRLDALGYCREHCTLVLAVAKRRTELHATNMTNTTNMTQVCDTQHISNMLPKHRNSEYCSLFVVNCPCHIGTTTTGTQVLHVLQEPLFPGNFGQH
jgi:hypothetical protein